MTCVLPGPGLGIDISGDFGECSTTRLARATYMSNTRATGLKPLIQKIQLI
jgi:hypothetical protein